MLKSGCLLFAVALVFSIQGCVTDDTAKKDSLKPLSRKEVSEMLPGNTFTTTAGDSYYFDSIGMVAGAASGTVLRGRWTIDSEGRVCLGGWNGSAFEPSCFKVYYDRGSMSHKLLDGNGDTRFEIKESVKGNINNY